MTEKSFEEPRLVPAGQGFSVLNTVEYRGRFLYSKYSPDRTIKDSVSKLTVLPGTIVLICSPCLWYGLRELIECAGDQCLFVALEKEKPLLELAQSQLESITSSCKEQIPESCIPALFSLEEAEKLDSFIRDKVNLGKYRRILKIDFSAGVQFNRDAFDFAASGIQEIIERFWKNRITLTKFGRLYSKNLFRNLSSLKDSLQVSHIKSCIDHGLVLVLGAGESLDQFFDFLEKENLVQAIKESFYTIAVDAALPCILQRGFVPDGVVLVESQFAITKAFLVDKEKLKDTVLFCDMCSRPSISRKNSGFGQKVYFASRFADGTFLDRLKDDGIILEYVQGLGSVGLVAMELAKWLSPDPQAPLVFTGMDFSYTPGITHAKNAPAHTARLFASTRLMNIHNVDSAFSPSALAALGKDGRVMRTTPAMKNYSEYFSRLNVTSEKAIFDASYTGLPSGAKQLNLDSLKDYVLALKSAGQKKTPLVEIIKTIRSNEHLTYCNQIENFLETEKQALGEIRDLLVNGESSALRKTGISLEQQLKELLLPREYLYLHFPDGYCLSMNIQFLKRIRPELDVFLKILG